MAIKPTNVEMECYNTIFFTFGHSESKELINPYIFLFFSLYTDISKCYTGLGSPDCDQPLPPFVKRSRDLANLVCRHENGKLSLY